MSLLSLLAAASQPVVVDPPPGETYDPPQSITYAGTTGLSEVGQQERATLTGVVKGSWTDDTNVTDAGLMFRATDTDNGLLLYVDLHRTGFTGAVRLYKVVAGVRTQLATWNTGKAPSWGPAYKLDLYDDNITITLDGDTVNRRLTVHESHGLTGTKAGFVTKSTGTAPQAPQITMVGEVFSGLVLNWPRSETGRQSTNPQVALTPAGTYGDVDLNNPNVQWDQANSRWVLNYTSYDGNTEQEQTYSFAYAPTLDGPWTVDPANPKFVDTDSGKWSMNGGFLWVPRLNKWLICYGAGGTAEQFWFATSPDLTTWTKTSTIYPAPGVHNAADSFLRLREDGTTIELYYSDRSATPWSVSRAISTDDGVTWTKDTGFTVHSPLFTTDIPFAEPSVLVPPGHDEQVILVFADCVDPSGSDGGRFIGCAMSLDAGSTWHWRIASRGSQAWDSSQNFDSYPVYDAAAGRFHLFYGGAAVPGHTLNIGIQIGHQSCAWDASSPPVVLDARP